MKHRPLNYVDLLPSSLKIIFLNREETKQNLRALLSLHALGIYLKYHPLWALSFPFHFLALNQPQLMLGISLPDTDSLLGSHAFLWQLSLSWAPSTTFSTCSRQIEIVFREPMQGNCWHLRELQVPNQSLGLWGTLTDQEARRQATPVPIGEASADPSASSSTKSPCPGGHIKKLGIK